jgi:hypothetical protein
LSLDDQAAVFISNVEVTLSANGLKDEKVEGLSVTPAERLKDLKVTGKP